MAKNGKKETPSKEAPGKATQEEMDLKLKDTPLGKRCRELIGIQNEFSEVQSRMSKKKEEVIKLLKEAKRDELRIEGKRIYINPSAESLSVTTVKIKD